MNFHGSGPAAALRAKVHKLGLLLNQAHKQEVEELLQEERFLEVAGQFVREFRVLHSALGARLPGLVQEGLAEEESEKRDDQECPFYGDKLPGNKLIISSSIKDYQLENRQGTTYYYQNIDALPPASQTEKTKPSVKSPGTLPKKGTKPQDSPPFVGIKKENWFTNSEKTMPKKPLFGAKLCPQPKAGSPSKLSKPSRLR
jgi:hypothetical protein